VEGDVDLPVVADLGDVAFQFVGVVEFFEDLVFEEEAGVLAIDDDLVAHVGFAEDEEIDFGAFGVGGHLVREVSADALGGDEAVALGIDMDVGHDGLADARELALLAIRKEEVFGEAPVEEGSGIV